MDKIKEVLDEVERLLLGEPARFIGYGAALLVVGIVAVANALGVTRLGGNLSLTDALGMATVATGTLVALIESIRRFVYSPATVARIVLSAQDTPTHDPGAE